jgi:hypothetical protein
LRVCSVASPSLPRRFLAAVLPCSLLRSVAAAVVAVVAVYFVVLVSFFCFFGLLEESS